MQSRDPQKEKKRKIIYAAGSLEKGFRLNAMPEGHEQQPQSLAQKFPL